MIGPVMSKRAAEIAATSGRPAPCYRRARRPGPRMLSEDGCGRSARGVILDRYGSRRGGASGRRGDLEPAADLVQALAHARQSDALRDEFAAPSAEQAANAEEVGHALAGILDRQHDPSPVGAARRIR